MSMTALAGAVRETIQTMLGLNTTPNANGMVIADLTCDLTSEGQPKPASGQVFYGIVLEGMSSNSTMDLDRDFRLKVIITLRSDYSPVDRTGTELLLKAKTTANTGGLWARVEELIDKDQGGLHLNYSVLDKAGGSYGGGVWTGGKSYSLANTVNGFAQPLAFRSAIYLGVKGPDWFWGDSAGEGSVYSGVAAEVVFAFARRIQVVT